MHCCVQVFVFCCSHADQIKAYLAESKWARSRDMVVQTIVSKSCLSVGEALRIVDDKVNGLKGCMDTAWMLHRAWLPYISRLSGC